MRKLGVPTIDDNRTFLGAADDLAAALPRVARTERAIPGAETFARLPRLNPVRLGGERMRPVIMDTRKIWRGQGQAVSELPTPVGEHAAAAGGEVARVASIDRAVDERARSEDARERLASIVESANDAIIGRALDGKITSWNGAARRLLGYTAAEAIGHDLTLTAPDRCDETAQDRGMLGAGNAVLSYETVQVGKDGRAIDVSVSGSPITDAGGNVVGTATILRDITEQKRSRKMLEFSNAVLSTQQETSLDAIMVMDENRNVVSYNRRFIELWNIPETVVRDGDDESVLEGFTGQVADPAAFRSRIEHLYANKFEKSHEEILLKDGRVIDRYSAPMSGIDTRYCGRIWFFRDITERKRSEKALFSMNCALQRKADLAQLVESMARAANETSSLEDTLRACLERIFDYGRWSIGHLMYFAPGTSPQILSESHWHVPDSRRFAEFIAETDKNIYGSHPGGFISTALAERKPSWISDLSGAGGFKRAPLAKKLGIRTGFVFPVVVDGAVLACLEFYAVDAREPDTQFLAAIATIGSQLARVIERKRALDDARGNEQKLNSILGALQEVVWSMDPKTGRLLYLNAAAEKVAGCSIGDLLAKPRLWRRMLHREDRQAVFSSIRKLRKDGRMIHEFRLVLADGEIRTVENRVQVVCCAGGKARRIDGTLIDVTARKVAEQQLRDHALRLQSMSHQLLEAQESERNRIARELHDQAGQMLTVLKIKLEMLERKSGARAVAPEVAECTQLAADTLDQLRNVMLELRPPQLAELGLATALRTHAEQQLGAANVALHFAAAELPATLSHTVQIACFRIAQEAVTNILRHAGARNVWITLGAAGGNVFLTVRDDGKGFDAPAARKRAAYGRSIGLLSMEERTALAGGRLEIETSAGFGCTVMAAFHPAGRIA